MKKYLILTTVIILSAFTAIQAQEYKLAKSSGKLVINLSSVKVEGYNGSEIVISSDRGDREEDPRAKGLRPINGSGVIDNTGVGVNVTDKGATVEVTGVTTRNGQIKIMVPKGISVSYTYQKVDNAGKAHFNNLESELEISVLHNNVELENVTGPMSIKTVYGSVDAKFSDNIKGPVSIASIYGHVDVAIPVATKANIKMNTSYGEILAAADLKIELEKNTNAEMISYSNKVTGKLNGGGLDMTLRSDYAKIYLRKTN